MYCWASKLFFLCLVFHLLNITSGGRKGGKGHFGGGHKSKYFCKDQSASCPQYTKYLEFVIGNGETCPDANSIYFPNFKWPFGSNGPFGRSMRHGWNKGNKLCDTVS